MWYRTNKLTGKYLLAAGIVQLVGLAIISMVVQDSGIAAVSSLAVIVVPLLTSILISYLQVRKF